MRNVYDNIKINWLLGRLSNGALSRREFMGRATALGVTAALATTVANMAIAGQGAASPETAAQFVNRFGSQAIEALGRPNLTDENREALVRDLLLQGLDLRFIGRFVLGKHWRGATPTQRSDYLALFESYMVKTYATWFARNTGERLIVVDARQVSDKDVVVRTQIDRRNDAPIIADWRVRFIDNRERIIDIASNGISLAGNQRLEFDAVIQRYGLDGLIAFLRER